MKIADKMPEVTYFTFVKGAQMYLEGQDNFYNGKGPFHYGDVIFFKGTPWYGTAPGLADSYEKVNEKKRW